MQDLVGSQTDVFEIDSEHVGARFAVWVTRPQFYELSDAYYPAVYMPDGNTALASTATMSLLMPTDPMDTTVPVLQVTVGYLAEDAQNAIVVRNRDLLPPGEPVAAVMRDRVSAMVATGAITQEQADGYLHSLSQAHADRFAAFLQYELHPLICERYRAEHERAGLFGYSFGGLFALYMALTKHPLFDRIGAGSPGVQEPVSRVFDLERDLAVDPEPFDDVQLHVTVNERELTGEMPLYRSICTNALTLVDQLSSREHKGLTITSSLLQGETHLTGFGAAYASFLRTCYRPQVDAVAESR